MCTVQLNKDGELVAVTESGDTRSSLVNRFVDVEEVREFLKEKKVLIANEPPDTKDSLPPKKKGNAPKADQPPAKDGTATPGPQPSKDDEMTAARLMRTAKLFREGEDNRPVYIAKLK
ncbi:MAG TPA: hypothetical protein VHR66_21280 [Gemmataceae bacterium]|jgi:hypothetical protein|nr:hypothetical protein [Gemmataceae bacterium]